MASVRFLRYRGSRTLRRSYFTPPCVRNTLWTALLRNAWPILQYERSVGCDSMRLRKARGSLKDIARRRRRIKDFRVGRCGDILSHRYDLSFIVKPEHIERYERILHPETIIAIAWEYEEHPIITRNAPATAESFLLCCGRRREFYSQGHPSELASRVVSDSLRFCPIGRREEQSRQSDPEE